jgi:DNA-directed RNA polymerase specialized sigma24 family protein
MSEMNPSGESNVTRLLVNWGTGDQQALEKLMPLVYDELRRLAGAYMRREKSGHTLQSTAVVHEAFLKLVQQRDVLLSGDQVNALVQYRKTKEFAQARLEADSHDLDARTVFSIAVAHIGMQETRLAISGDGIAKVDEAVEQVEKAMEADPAQTFYKNLLVVGYAYQGRLRCSRGT